MKAPRINQMTMADGEETVEIIKHLRWRDKQVKRADGAVGFNGIRVGKTRHSASGQTGREQQKATGMIGRRAEHSLRVDLEHKGQAPPRLGSNSLMDTTRREGKWPRLLPGELAMGDSAGPSAPS